MFRYEINVKGLESYIVIADDDATAIVKAIDYFKDDDLYYDSEEADDVTENDCKIICKEEN